ncbi:hypothetical protein ACA910_022642 [Epithemia clementina (nom. ined.)]
MRTTTPVCILLSAAASSWSLSVVAAAAGSTTTTSDEAAQGSKQCVDMTDESCRVQDDDDDNNKEIIGTDIDPTTNQTGATTTTTTTKQLEESPFEFLECHTYMAPSTLGEGTNMGMYTGVPLRPGDVVHWPEIVVPIQFREWGEHKPGFTDGQLWDRYIWHGTVVGLESYDDLNTDDSKAAFIPGIGCTINGVMDAANIESTHSSQFDTAGLHRRQDPGAGAFTPYHSSLTKAASQPIAAGSELLADYGKEWVPEIPGVQMTLDYHMDPANDFFYDEYWPFVMTATTAGLPDTVKQALWEFTVNFPVYNADLTNLPRKAEWSQIEDFVRRSRYSSTSDKDDEDDLERPDIVRHFWAQSIKRSLEWLQTHPNSYCQDHLRPNISKIPQAGRGAFATRHLPAGTVVGYSPLIHMGKDGRAVFDISYPAESDPYNNGGKKPRHIYDLVINYSFGHPNSTMILTPYGGMVNYINHDSNNPNVQVRFPNKELIAHKPEWLLKDPEFFHLAVEKIGLSFEYVALRDITEGEEVVMDYGPVWEQAWQEHVAAWEPLEQDYEHSLTWHEPEHGSNYYRTIDEQVTNPYPMNLHTLCSGDMTYQPDPDSSENSLEYVFVSNDGQDVAEDASSRLYCKIVARRPVDDVASNHPGGKKDQDDDDDDEGEDEDDDDDEEEEDKDYVYDIYLRIDHADDEDADDLDDELMDDLDEKLAIEEMNQVLGLTSGGSEDAAVGSSNKKEMSFAAGEQWILVKNVDSSAIVLTDKIFSADWHLPNAFRHYIQIPDSVMPPTWLNGPDSYQLGQSSMDQDNDDEDEEEVEEEESE